MTRQLLVVIAVVVGALACLAWATFPTAPTSSPVEDRITVVRYENGTHCYVYDHDQQGTGISCVGAQP